MKKDLIVAVILAFLGTALCYSHLNRIMPEVASHTAWGWFDGDISKRVDNYSKPDATWGRDHLHPINRIMFAPLVGLFENQIGMGKAWALTSVLLAQSFLWGVLLYLCLRSLEISVIGSILFTSIGMTSSSFLFWFSVPELFSAGSVGLLAFIFALFGPMRDSLKKVAIVLSGVWVGGSTITNLMFPIVGLVGSALTSPKRLAVWKMAFAIWVVLGGLWFLAYRVYPATVNIRPGIYLEERGFLREQGPQQWANFLVSFFSHTIVMPEIEVIRKPTENYELPVGSIQNSPMGSGGGLAALASVSWLALFAFGAYEFLKSKSANGRRLILGGFLFGQMALHTVYGFETFLFSPHWLPLLVLLAAFVDRSHFRRGFLALAAFLVVAGFMVNQKQFINAANFVVNGRPRMQMDFTYPGSSLSLGQPFEIPDRSVSEPQPYLANEGAFIPGPRSFRVDLMRLSEGFGQGNPMLAGDFLFDPNTANGSYRILEQKTGLEILWNRIRPGQWLMTWKLAAKPVPLESGAAISIRALPGPEDRIWSVDISSHHRVTINGRWELYLSDAKQSQIETISTSKGPSILLKPKAGSSDWKLFLVDRWIRPRGSDFSRNLNP